MKPSFEIRFLACLLIVTLAASACQLAMDLPFTASAEAGSILYAEDFSDPASGWERSSQGGLKDYYLGTYQVRITDPNTFSWSVANQTFGDVRIEVDVAFTGSASLAEMGVICRMQNSADFYFFTIRSDGAFAVFRMYQGNENFLGMEGYQTSDAIRVGISTNHILVQCSGEQLTLVVNDVRLISVEDASYQVGDVGVLVGAFDEPDVNVFFDNFFVYQP